MKDLNKKYIKMLDLEFEDLLEDIQILINEEKEKKDHEVISEYVYLENLAILQTEIRCLRGFIKEIDSLDTSKYKGCGEMVDDIKQIFKRKFKEYGFNQFSMNILLKKIEKINKYICEVNK